MEVRPFIATDVGQIGAILQKLWGHDPVMLEQYGFMHRDWPTDGGLIRRTLVATESDDTYRPHRQIFEQAPANDVDRNFVIMANE